MEGKTDSRTSGEVLLHGPEMSVDPIDRVSIPRQFMYMIKRLQVRF